MTTPSPRARAANDAHANDAQSGARKAPRRLLDKPPVAPGEDLREATPQGSDGDAQLPHERDQSTGGDSTGGMGTGAAGEQQREVMGQAHEDLKRGQVDTDLRATPGLDAERRDDLIKRPDGGSGARPAKPGTSKAGR